MPEEMCEDCSRTGCLVCEPAGADGGPGWEPMHSAVTHIFRQEIRTLSGVAVLLVGAAWMWVKACSRRD